MTTVEFETVLEPNVMFLEKATDGRVTVDDIEDALSEYKRLYKAGIASPAEMLTLSRAYPDITQYSKALTKMGISDDDSLVIGGPASIELIDREGHLITTNALEKAEEIQDDMVAGTITLKDYRKEVKKFNKECKDKKMPFKFKQIKGNTHEVMSKLMTTMPNELFDWDDNRLKDQCETIAWNQQFGGGGWNNGY